MLRTCMIYFLTKWNLQQQGITVNVSTIKAAHPQKLGYMLLKNIYRPCSQKTEQTQALK